jgi:hypothetical protein
VKITIPAPAIIVEPLVNVDSYLKASKDNIGETSEGSYFEAILLDIKSTIKYLASFKDLGMML